MTRADSWQRFAPLLLLLPFALFFLFFQVGPMVWVIINSVRVEGSAAFSLDNFTEIINDPFYRQAFSNSLELAISSSVIGMVIATLAAASLRKVDSRLQRWMVAFTNMTSNFAGVPLAFAFVVILGFNGSITLLLKQMGLIEKFDLYGFNGLLLIYIYFQIPLGILLLYPAFDALEDDWEEAAALLGASPVTYWRMVLIPVLAPALLGTFIILLANALGAYASAYGLTAGSFNLVTIRIASLVSGDLFLEPNLAAAVSVLLMAILAVIAAAGRLLQRGGHHGK